MLAVYSPLGHDGAEIISATADSKIRGWKHDKVKYHQVIKVQKARPSEDDLSSHREKAGKLINYSERHVLNTPKALSRKQTNHDTTAYAFTGDQTVTVY